MNNVNVIYVEGDDEVSFFKKYLEFLNIPNVTIEKVGGKNKYKRYIQLQSINGNLDNYKRILFSQDADESPASTIDSLIEICIQYLEFPREKRSELRHGSIVEFSGKKLGFFVFPDGGPGMLETLFNASFSSHPTIDCVNSFQECIERKGIPERDSYAGTEVSTNRWEYPNNKHKSRAKSILSILPKDIRSIGEAALRGDWDLSHESLDPLKILLTSIFTRS